MNPAVFKERLTRYYRKHGVTGFLKHAVDKLAEKLFQAPEVIYAVDLPQLTAPRHELPDSWSLAERKAQAEMTAAEIDALYEQLGQLEMNAHMKERFGKGASLWLLGIDGSAVGMVWSESAPTLWPHCMALGPHDLHLFDNVVFEAFRGQGINPVLIETVLQELKRQGFSRLYIETNWRNIPERRSIRKTSFQPLGVASVQRRGGKIIAAWDTTRNPDS